jgi:hypothetical protein
MWNQQRQVDQCRHNGPATEVSARQRIGDRCGADDAKKGREGRRSHRQQQRSTQLRVAAEQSHSRRASAAHEPHQRRREKEKKERRRERHDDAERGFNAPCARCAPLRAPYVSGLGWQCGQGG